MKYAECGYNQVSGFDLHLLPYFVYDSRVVFESDETAKALSF